MTVSRLPNARFKDFILRLPLGVAQKLSLAASREGVDAEIIVERIIEKFYSVEGKTISEKAREQASEAQAQLQRHHKSLGLTKDAGGLVRLSADLDIVSEVARLSAIANDG